MVEEVMGFDADLIRYDRDLTKQHADEEFREGIAENLDTIKELLINLSFGNLTYIRSLAQDIVDDCDRRLP
jgi:hypothetical protein